jgi:3-oxoacyl-[acyl-carrier-protein] synthase II
MSDRRVAITGVGVVTPAGIGAGDFWEALLAGRRAVEPIRLFDASGFPSRIAGQLDGFSARPYVPKSYRKSVKVMARDIEIAVAAADLAFRDASIATRAVEDAGEPVEPKRLGCNIGAGLINADLDELGLAASTAVVDGRFDLKAWGAGGMENLTPLWLLKYLPNMLACHVTIIHGCEGPSNNITCGAASGHLGVGESARWISRGEAEVVVAGGAETKLNPMGMLRQVLLGRLRTGANDSAGEACRPFDAGHRGTVVGEGGGLIVLEELTRAVERKADIYAEVIGAGAACDPAGIDVPAATAGSLDLAVRKALDDAGAAPDDVDLIVAHGTGVAEEDALEARAWSEALGAAAEEAHAVAVTGAVGSLFAGAGAVEIATAALAIREQKVPPTVNFASPAPGCALNLSGRPRDAEIRTAVTAAFSIAGQSAACVLRRFQP